MTWNEELFHAEIAAGSDAASARIGVGVERRTAFSTAEPHGSECGHPERGVRFVR